MELCLTVPVRLSSLLPYLPMLMDPLVSTLNGSQRPVSQVSDLYLSHMKDLFVELCLTVPVRLSSLLPYLPMLMDPLVSALNGSQRLVSQVRDLYLSHMKDLFVELCLTVPVHLSSLLPYLPMLMDPLVSALNGSQTHVSQVCDLYLSHMKDLFVELCLTVPVRLSSLLPYLPMLMDPLVSALNGSQTLVSQVSDCSISPRLILAAA